MATLPATTVSAATATLNGTINPNGGNSSWWFEWGPGMTYTNRTPATAAGSGTNTAAISANIPGLQPGQTYHFRMIGSNAAGLGIGTDAYLQTPPVLTLNGPSRVTNYVGAPFNDPGAVASTIPIAVSAGYREVAVLKADGQIVNWGSSASFTRPSAGLSNFVSLQSGQDYMIAVRNDGVPFGFGIFYGSIPTGVTNISAISVGDYAFADALLPNGSVLSWGMPFFFIRHQCPVRFDQRRRRVSRLLRFSGAAFRWNGCAAGGLLTAVISTHTRRIKQCRQRRRRFRYQPRAARRWVHHRLGSDLLYQRQPGLHHQRRLHLSHRRPHPRPARRWHRHRLR